MTLLRRASMGLSHWLDVVARATVGAFAAMRSSRTIVLAEDDDGAFRVKGRSGRAARALPTGQRIERGAEGRIVLPDALARTLRRSRVELLLKPERFLFRDLELPARAVEFLDGVVRAQIDRITPWSDAEAAYGWTAPVPAGQDRIAVTVAASAKALIDPYVRAFAAVAPRAVTVATTFPQAGEQTIPIRGLDQAGSGTSAIRRVRFLLAALLLIAAAAAVLATGAAAVIGPNLVSRQDAVAAQIAKRRAAIGAVLTAGSGPPSAAVALERRKHETPSSVITVDVLSRLLPDHTYLTELRIEGQRLRMSGVTRDAPELIRLLEQSPHFKEAKFFAPTIRAPTDLGERFNIEAQIQPIFRKG